MLCPQHNREEKKNLLGEARQEECVGKKKIHLMKWKKVCMHRHKGGLGLDNLGSRNSALLLKWWWKWFSERRRMWWNFIQTKYNLESHLGLDQCWNRNDLSLCWRISVTLIIISIGVLSSIEVILSENYGMVKIFSFGRIIGITMDFSQDFIAFLIWSSVMFPCLNHCGLMTHLLDGLYIRDLKNL